MVTIGYCTFGSLQVNCVLMEHPEYGELISWHLKVIST